MSKHYENKMMTTKTPGVTVIVIDDLTKRCQDKVLGKYVLSGKYSKENLAAEEIRKIITGKA